MESQEIFFDFSLFLSYEKKTTCFDLNTGKGFIFLTKNERPKCGQIRKTLFNMTDNFGFPLQTARHILTCKACSIAVMEMIGYVNETAYLMSLRGW